MRGISLSLDRLIAGGMAALGVSALLIAGCGGSSGGMLSQAPITVKLPISTVVVMPAGSPTTIPIQIQSTSETALVSLSGLPGGVQAKYAASDTNPSGILTFTANASTMTGTSMPTVTVMSAGQTAMTRFTLVVKTM
ncbi:MAG TPA: hypothetical protein VKR52_14890 [Terracidiphilus sp.]|nr:hypothetical protein [Terracidiphilus sp.]